ncbi:hypothetical protein [Granulicella sp. dw_53]|uniref:YncE family protein n=1 Tax=Granulicella sp. dw_53 TaxID=2719792 RepID=UPI001BD5F501|nr:hypothetical protein [Granulicella sp. dw_53]
MRKNNSDSKDVLVSGRIITPHGVLLGALLILSSLTQSKPLFAASHRVTNNHNAISKTMRRGETVLVVQEGPGKVVIFSAFNPSQSKTVDVGEKPHEIELTEDGETAFVSNFGLLDANHRVGTPGTTISVLDIKGGVERTRFHLPEGLTAPHGLKLRPPAYQELFTNTEEGKEEMIVFEANSGAVRRHFALPHGVHNFIFNADGTALFAFATTSEIFRIDPDHGTVTATAKLSSPRGFTWTADQRQLIVGCLNELVLLDPETLSVIHRFGDLGGGQIFYPAVTLDGRWILAPALLDGVVLMVNAITGAVEHRIETGSPLQIIPDGRRAWVSNVRVPASMLKPNAKPANGGVVLIDLNTFSMMPIGEIPDNHGIAVTMQRN